ncbi:unnamed protein product [Hymenolepis diminuta]|uniref:Uncharacterized protein n=1 Tax=Hymenolepis diminuta TaxID=6216 RepID=A0A564Z5I6_HYMDI|nr:unnamed protein product [Hymenolepis diminuta]
MKMQPSALIASVVFFDVSDIISDNMECESINIKLAKSVKGLAKSTYTLLHGVFF